MTNHEFELSLFNTNERVIHELEDILWSTYDDFKEHTLKPDSLSPKGRRLVERCILFLHSDLEFNWPSYPSWWKALLGWITLKPNKYQRQLDAYRNYGDENFWPFRSNEELKIESARPRIGLSLKYQSK
ncbi:hypothetical protein [Litorimonas sp. WD9-15]|uniref:hypothetical protein n=1 Tax=Litorimonas sp. WD9-15 TaxID=3418716 RepID=UPI003D065319